MGVVDFISLALATVVWFLICMVLTVIVHEMGHLVGGLISGYRLSGFAVCGVILRRQHGKLGLHRYRMQSLNWGQCFMSGDVDTEPKMLIAGGCVINILLGAVFTILSVLTLSLDEKGVWRLMLLAVPASINMIMGLANLVGGSPTSDGNTLKEVRTEDGKKMYNRSMMITAGLLDGHTYSDMPTELFKYDGNSSLAEEIRMYEYYRKNETCKTAKDYKELVKEYGFSGKQKGFFTEEKETESEIAKAVFKKSEENRVGKLPVDGREFLLMMAKADKDDNYNLVKFEYECPMPGVARSVSKCWDNIKKIRTERSGEHG